MPTKRSSLKFENLETRDYALMTRPEDRTFVVISKRDPLAPGWTGDEDLYRELKATYLSSRTKFNAALRSRTRVYLKKLLEHVKAH